MRIAGGGEARRLGSCRQAIDAGKADPEGGAAARTDKPPRKRPIPPDDRTTATTDSVALVRPVPPITFGLRFQFDDRSPAASRWHTDGQKRSI
jgi:hypothetical protein